MKAEEVNGVLHSVAKRVWATLPKEGFESDVNIEDFGDVIMLSACAGNYKEALLHYIEDERELTLCNDLLELNIGKQFNLELSILADIIAFVNLAGINSDEYDYSMWYDIEGTQNYIDEFWEKFTKKAEKYILFLKPRHPGLLSFLATQKQNNMSLDI